MICSQHKRPYARPFLGHSPGLAGWIAVGALLLTQAGPAHSQYAPSGKGLQHAVAPVYHTLQPGETLRTVAGRYGVTLADLRTANHLDGSGLDDDSGRPMPRKRLRIPRRRTPASRTISVSASPRPERLSITFTNMDVRQVLGQIAEYSRTDVLLTPGAKGLVSVSLRNRTPEEAIRMAAATAGLTVSKIGGAYLVGPSEEVKKALIDFRRSVLVPLAYVPPSQIKEMISRTHPLVDVDVVGSAVMISGLPAEVAAARAQAVAMDVKPDVPAPKIETDLIHLQHADPAASERVLRDAFPNLKVSREGKTLVMRGVAGDMAAAEHALKELDVEPPKEAPVKEARVYRLKYLHSKKAEEALSKAFPKDRLTITEAPEPTAPPQANFTPLSSAIGGLVGGNGSGGGGGGGGAAGGGGLSGGGASGSSGASGGGAGGQGGGQGGGPQQLSRSTRLILIGSHQDIEMALQILEETDLPQQVFRIEAVLAEINKDDFRNLGITWDFSGTNQTFTVPPANGDLRFGALTHTPLSVTAQLQALQTQNRARILAHPNISAMDNEDANIFIGRVLRFPGTVVVTNNATVQGTDTVPDGIVLLVRGHYNPEDNTVTLKVHPVISTAVFDSRGLPQISSREADTTVRLKAGEELVIGGLDREDISSNLQKVPILGDIPVIGQFFRSYTHTKTKSEIVVAVRVYPMTVDAAPGRDFRKVLRPEPPKEGEKK